MSVEEWARGQAERRYPQGWSDDPTRVRLGRESAEWMAGHAFDALLSDEAVRAAARGIGASDHPIGLQIAQSALQAAVDAVTEGEGDE